jgi:hypothetical protein
LVCDGYTRPRESGTIVGVEHTQGDLGGGHGGEEDVDFVAEAEVLRALADVEHQLALALAGVLGIDL